MSFKEQRTDAKPSHAPVMLREVVEILRPHQGGVYVDGSFGGGGHASALLDCADCVLVGVDRDAETLEEARALEKKYDGGSNSFKGALANFWSASMRWVSEGGRHHAGCWNLVPAAGFASSAAFPFRKTRRWICVWIGAEPL